MQHPYILSDTTFTVFIEGKPYQTDRTNPSWDAIKKLISIKNLYSNETELLIQYMSPIKGIEKAVENVKEINVRNGAVFYGEEKIHDALSKRLLDVMSENINIDPWVKFTQNLFANSQTFARQELYDFLESSDLPITSDGCFLAYK